jgi:probable HAF family extracellular repeat protein
LQLDERPVLEHHSESWVRTSLKPAFGDLAMICLRWFAFTLLLSLASLSTVAQTVIHDANITFTTVDVPGAKETDIYSVNNFGDMTGSYKGINDNYAKGFAVINGTFKLFVYPSGEDTVTGGINDSRLISGSSFVNGFSELVSWLYNGQTFTTIRAPGKSITWAHGLNNDAVIVGSYEGGQQMTGFVRIGHRFKTIAPPGDYFSVGALGINNRSEIVGSADDDGFFYRGGQYKTLMVPGASQTAAWGINDNGIVVGWYFIPTCTCGFALMNGKYLSIRYPGAIATFASGINNAGEVVGTYELEDFTYHGFVTSPITPADFE